MPSTIDAIGGGCAGVVAGIAAPSLRSALSRLAVQVTMARPGISIEAAREAVGTSFDVAVELSKPEQGRLRIQRIAELDGADANGIVARDIFVATQDASSSDSNTPAFVSTGNRPQLLQSFAARASSWTTLCSNARSRRAPDAPRPSRGAFTARCEP